MGETRLVIRCNEGFREAAYSKAGRRKWQDVGYELIREWLDGERQVSTVEKPSVRVPKEHESTVKHLLYVLEHGTPELSHALEGVLVAFYQSAKVSAKGR